MTRESLPARVVMYDPGAFLPYYVDSLCRNLAALGLEPEVIASPPLFHDVPARGYRVATLFFPSLRGVGRALVRHRRLLRRAVKGLCYPAGLWRSWRALRAGPPGLLHLQWAPVPFLDALLVGALRRRGWRIAYTVHDPLPHRTARYAFRLHQRLLTLSDAVIVHTLQQQEQMARDVPLLGRRLHVVPHGATAVPLPDQRERAICRRRVGLPPGRPLLLFFGQLKSYKGLEYLLAAMPAVIARYPRVLLVIAGEPLMFMRPITRYIDRLGLTGHVVLRPAFVPDEQVPSYLHAADALVAPYVRVGASGVVALAQGHGLPVVVTSVGGLPEFVERGACGLVVPPRSAGALAEALCQALSDPAALAAMGRRGWARVNSENRWTDVAERTLAVYRGVTSSTEELRPSMMAVP